MTEKKGEYLGRKNLFIAYTPEAIVSFRNIEQNKRPIQQLSSPSPPSEQHNTTPRIMQSWSSPLAVPNSSISFSSCLQESVGRRKVVVESAVLGIDFDEAKVVWGLG